MTVLLSGRWSAAEGERWARLLHEAMPEEQWLLQPPRSRWPWWPTPSRAP